MQAAFDNRYVTRLDGPNGKKQNSKRGLAEALRQDIRDAIKRTGADRAVMVWCGSTEIYLTPSSCHASIEAFEKGLDANDPNISPSQLYAYAAIMEGVPTPMARPICPPTIRRSKRWRVKKGVPLAGKDFKTGQTLVKTALAPALQGAHAGSGWLVLDQHPGQSRR